MITLNAFTSGFHGAVSTTGKRVPRYVQWVYGEYAWGGVTLFEDGEMFTSAGRNARARVRLGWLVEPRALRPENYARAWDVRRQFDGILTYDAELLAADPGRFILCPRMGVHVPESEWGERAKSKNVAMLTTYKTATAGHALRREVAQRYGPKGAGLVDVYGMDGEGAPYADKVAAFAPYRFVIVIESERAPNLFTEHLLDAVALGCVPVYWGAPNIGDFLERKALVEWETLDYLDVILRGLARPDFGAETTHRLMAPQRAKAQARLGEYALVEDWLAVNVLPQFGVSV